MKASLKKVLISGLALLAFAGPTQASDMLVKSTGLSDETLFIILFMLALFQLVVILIIAGAIRALATNSDLWKPNSDAAKALSIIALLLMGSSAHAQAGEVDFNQLVTLNDTGFLLLILVNLFLLVTFLYLVAKLNMILRMMAVERGKELEHENFMARIKRMLTRTVPLEEEEAIAMDHVYDGIRELDNRLPPWWLWMFYGSIAFAVVYMFNYHVLQNAPLQKEEYEMAMAEAAKAKASRLAGEENSVDESNVTFLEDASALASGEKAFKLYCAPCHGESGGSAPGGVGPNLTDDYWIHGGDIKDIFATIKYGVPSKGMVSWEAQLRPRTMQEVASYIKSIHGSNPPNAKERQGELYEEVKLETEADTLTSADIIDTLNTTTEPIEAP